MITARFMLHTDSSRTGRGEQPGHQCTSVARVLPAAVVTRSPGSCGARLIRRTVSFVLPGRRRAIACVRLVKLLRPCSKRLSEHARGHAVFAIGKDGKPFRDLPRAWNRIAERGGLQSITPHTLRHSFATTANALGCSEPTIAAMLGHSRGTMTSRYVHVVDATLLAAADRVSDAIMRAMNGERPVTVKNLDGRRKALQVSCSGPPNALIRYTDYCNEEATSESRRDLAGTPPATRRAFTCRKLCKARIRC